MRGPPASAGIHAVSDCIHIPSAEDTADDLRTDPKAAFAALSGPAQDRAFTKAGAEAIRLGADLSQVVNARSGMTTAGVSKTRVRDDGLVVNERIRRQVTRVVAGRAVLTTTAGGKRGRVRLMPEQILRDAKGDRDEALRLLKLHGFLTV